MQQIRVGWKRGTHAAREAGLITTDGGPWLPDTAEHRDDVAAMIQCGDEVCGKGTHWMEERTLVDATDSSEPPNRPPGPPEDAPSHA